MTMRLQPTRGLATLACLALLGTSATAVAGGYRDGLALSCENGRHYPIRATAISVAGELVAGYLETGRRHGVHFRLIPMGNGYRYAGRGIWFDGVRGDAVLNFGAHRSVDCTVTSPAS
jgi:hypothetical protein